METQIHFLGTSACPSFIPNPFRSDLCQTCSEKIYKHTSASDQHIKDALNFIVDKVPSLVWSDGPGNIYMGGYKSAINVPFLKEKSIGLIVNASGNLEQVMGSKYKRELMKRRSDKLAREIIVNWIDSEDQRLNSIELVNLIVEMTSYIKQGQSVLVHCAQGKSRSAVVVLAWILSHYGDTSVDEALELLKEKRPMAEPNVGFLAQLKQMKKDGSLRDERLNNQNYW